MIFLEKLRQSWEKSNSLLCVGLDPDISKLPDTVRKSKHPIFEFNKAIIDATHDLVCAYKPQIAFYAGCGAEAELELTMKYIIDRYPQLILILDSKRGDIPNTASLYVQECFDRYGADAVTVNPYLGFDSVAPFLERPDKAAIILCLTSNPGAKDFQHLEVKGEKLYAIVAKKAAFEWNKNQNVVLVVGATYPSQLGEIRALVKDTPFLVPGLGAQGGDVGQTVKNGIDSKGTGMIINSSREVLYASNHSNFDQEARKVALKRRDEINRCRKLSLSNASSP